MPHDKTSGRILRLAVVGHTNTGKTSLMRTLTRNPDFGEVRDEPGTTRDVKGVFLKVDGSPVIELFDTPGLEDSVDLRNYVARLSDNDIRANGPERIKRFLDSPESRRRFEQEARVFNKLLDCDAGLYVIDARDPVMPKHQDEIALLRDCGHPLVAVLNFTHRCSDEQKAQWRKVLKEELIHTTVDFDTVAPPLNGEAYLYQCLGAQIRHHAATLERLTADIARQKAERRKAAARLIAEMLVDQAAFRLKSAPTDEDRARTIEELRTVIVKRETACYQALLRLYGFHKDDYLPQGLPVGDGEWGMNLFSHEALREFGIQTGSSAAKGAAIGVMIDLATAGMTLGAAATLGGVLGALYGAIQESYDTLKAKATGLEDVAIAEAALRLLAVRQLALVNALERRGHAAIQRIDPDAPTLAEGSDSQTHQALLQQWRNDSLPDELKKARNTPEWSHLSQRYLDSPRRAAAVEALAKQLEQTQANK